MRMSRTQRSVAAGALALVGACFVSPARAEVLAKQWNFAYQFGGAFVSRDIGDDDLFQALRVGYNFTPWVAVEGSWSLIRTQDVIDDDLDSDVDLYGVDVLYHFRPDGSSVPYMLLGAGLVEVDLARAAGDSYRDSALFWGGGGGVKIPVNKWIDVRFDVRFQRYRLDREVAAPALLNGSLSDKPFASRTFAFGVSFHFPVERQPRAPKPEPTPAPPPAAPAPPPKPAPAPAPAPEPPAEPEPPAQEPAAEEIPEPPPVQEPAPEETPEPPAAAPEEPRQEEAPQEPAAPSEPEAPAPPAAQEPPTPQPDPSPQAEQAPPPPRT